MTNTEKLTVNIPSLDEIAKMYQRAVSAKDAGLKTLAEQAVTRLAVAEASIAEGATIIAFHNKVNQ